ncbi:MAG: hypothetical protein ABL962_01270 [Fimbriimonadaceae bacterium]
MSWIAEQELDWSTFGLGWVPIVWTILGVLFFVILQCRIVGKTGHSPWLGILWSIPLVGFFFQIWLVLADWPSTRAKANAATKRRKRRK